MWAQRYEKLLIFHCNVNKIYRKSQELYCGVPCCGPDKSVYWRFSAYRDFLVLGAKLHSCPCDKTSLLIKNVKKSAAKCGLFKYL